MLPGDERGWRGAGGRGGEKSIEKWLRGNWVHKFLLIEVGRDGLVD